MLGAGFIKFRSTLSKVIGDWGGGEGALRLRHNVLYFSFVVVLYSMYSLYAIIKVVLLNERDCHV